MSWYIVFNNFSSFPDMNEFADSAEDIKTAVADSIEKTGQAISEASQSAISAELITDTPPKVDDYLENPPCAVDEKPSADSASQIPLAIVIKSETPEPTGDEQNPEIQTKNVNQKDVYEEFHSLLRKFEISLQYRYDFTDISNDNKQIEDSRNFRNPIEKSLNKQRAVQEEDFERRFQEKQAESFKEHLKQKKTAT